MMNYKVVLLPLLEAKGFLSMFLQPTPEIAAKTEEVLNSMASSGWELTNVVPVSSKGMVRTHAYHYFQKRS